MKRRITLSLALALSIIAASLTSSDSTVKAQNQLRPLTDFGPVTLGLNQVLRLSVTAGFDPGPLDGKVVRFRRMEYTPGICSGGVCKLAVASQTTSDPITLMPGQAASFDIPASFSGGVFVGVGAVVLSNRRDVKITSVVFDTSTQRVVTFVSTTIDDESGQ